MIINLINIKVLSYTKEKYLSSLYYENTKQTLYGNAKRKFLFCIENTNPNTEQKCVSILCCELRETHFCEGYGIFIIKK